MYSLFYIFSQLNTTYLVKRKIRDVNSLIQRPFEYDRSKIKTLLISLKLIINNNGRN